jgi:hypothetical protein
LKILLLLAAGLIAWWFTDLKSDSILLCVIAPLLLSLVFVLSIAELVRAMGITLDADIDESGD